MPTQEEWLDTVQRLAALSSTTEKCFEQVNIRLEGMDAHLETMNTRLDRLETKVDAIETQLAEHKTLLTQILARLPQKP